MPIQTTYSNARENLASLLDAVEEDHEVVIVKRRGHRDVAMIDASELRSLEETVHLLRSPANAVRLLSAMQSSVEGKGTPFSAEDLRREMGLGAAR